MKEATEIPIDEDRPVDAPAFRKRRFGKWGVFVIVATVLALYAWSIPIIQNGYKIAQLRSMSSQLKTGNTLWRIPANIRDGISSFIGPQ